MFTWIWARPLWFVIVALLSAVSRELQEGFAYNDILRGRVINFDARRRAES